MRDINGNNNGTIYDESTTIVLNGGETYKDTTIAKEKISIKKILIEKVIEAIIGGFLAFITSLLGKYLSSNGSTTLQLNMHIVLIGLLLVCAVGAIVLLVSFAIDIIHIIQLTKKGKFVEFESKIHMVSTAVNTFKTNDTKSRTRSVGKVYKNIDGQIFKINSKKCPFCRSTPIGNMHLIRDVANSEYVWVCSEQVSHMLPFDYKDNF
ncbi:MAG TPA: hypothetical protein VHT96_05905 [Clostridia bacterium]|nr:hypothetical protein [Clostridia bacterium]